MLNEQSPRITLDAAFNYLLPERGGFADSLPNRLREKMTAVTTPHAYHNERHIVAVLACVFRWSAGEPSLPLVAAALYHDAVYDPTRHDNELQSAVFCHDELTRTGVPVLRIVQAINLILATAYHQPHLQNADEVTMVDADLFILGSAPATYETYVQAIRTEYRHLSDEQWRTGRRGLLERFLQRERLYHGTWDGCAEREAQARANITAEIASLR